MSMTLAIWKWRPLWPFRKESRVFRMLCDDKCPFALTRFDARAFAEELKSRFGNLDGENRDNDSPFIPEVCDFTGFRANWILMECGASVNDDVFTELLKMVERRGLHIYGE